VQHSKHEPFSLEDLVRAIATIYHIDDLLKRRAVDLLVLGSQQNCSGAYQLELADGDHLV
jgi:hypothetical protein